MAGLRQIDSVDEGPWRGCEGVIFGTLAMGKGSPDRVHTAVNDIGNLWRRRLGVGQGRAIAFITPCTAKFFEEKTVVNIGAFFYGPTQCTVWCADVG